MDKIESILLDWDIGNTSHFEIAGRIRELIVAQVEQAKRGERERIIFWLDEPCPHTGGLEEQQMTKMDCPKCWQALKEE